MTAVVKRETHTYTLGGDQTVNVAGQLLGKLPNGWTLKSLTYEEGWGKQWVAVVEGPFEDVK